MSSNTWPPRGFQTDGFGVTEEKPQQPQQTFQPENEWSPHEPTYSNGAPTYEPPPWVRSTGNPSGNANHASEWYTSNSLWEYIKRSVLIFILIIIIFCMIAFCIGAVAALGSM